MDIEALRSELVDVLDRGEAWFPTDDQLRFLIAILAASQPGQEVEDPAVEPICKLLLWNKQLRDDLADARAKLAQCRGREQNECEVCRWPRPCDTEHNICDCCGFQPGYDDASAYRTKWDGAWWGTGESAPPPVVENLRAKLASVERLVDELDEPAWVSLNVPTTELVRSIVVELRAALAATPDEKEGAPS